MADKRRDEDLANPVLTEDLAQHCQVAWIPRICCFYRRLYLPCTQKFRSRAKTSIPVQTKLSAVATLRAMRLEYQVLIHVVSVSVFSQPAVDSTAPAMRNVQSG